MVLDRRPRRGASSPAPTAWRNSARRSMELAAELVQQVQPGGRPGRSAVGLAVLLDGLVGALVGRPAGCDDPLDAGDPLGVDGGGSGAAGGWSVIAGAPWAAGGEVPRIP